MFGRRFSRLRRRINTNKNWCNRRVRRGREIRALRYRRGHWRSPGATGDPYGIMGKTSTIGNAKPQDQVLLNAAALPANPIPGEHAPLTRCDACYKHFQLACDRLELVPRVTPGCLLFAKRPRTTTEHATFQQRALLRRWRRINKRVPYEPV